MQTLYDRYIIVVLGICLFVCPPAVLSYSTNIESPYVTKSNTFKGQLHVHTTQSDGHYTPQQVTNDYKNNGYDFISLTDHRPMPIYGTPDYIYAPTTDPGVSGILFIPGAEQMTASDIAHMGRINSTHSFMGLTTNPQTMIDIVNNEGGITIINHPNWPKDNFYWTPQRILPLTGYAGLEIFNTYLAQVAGYTPNAENVWDVLLTAGKKTWGFSADDCHFISTDSNYRAAGCGTGYVSVAANTLTVAEIISNMKQGNFYSGYTPRGKTDITMRITTDNGVISVTVSPLSRIDFIGSGGIVKKSVGGTTATYTPLENEKYIRVKAYTSDAITWSNPLFITPANSPIGFLDSVDCSNIRGWAGDKDAPANQIDVHLYVDGPSGAQYWLDKTTANVVREQAVCDMLGDHSATCSHGFVYPFPQHLKNNASHTIYAYGINIPGTGGTNIQLLHSPKTITCPIPSPAVASPTPTSPVPKPGDANGDGLVDEADYMIWKAHYRQTVSGVASGDFNGDGVADGKDYIIWLTHADV